MLVQPVSLLIQLHFAALFQTMNNQIVTLSQTMYSKLLAILLNEGEYDMKNSCLVYRRYFAVKRVNSADCSAILFSLDHNI